MVPAVAIGAEVQGQRTQYHALDLQVRRAVGADRDGQEPHRTGAREGLYKTPHDTPRADGDRVLRSTPAPQRAVSNDGHRRTMSRFASQRDRGFEVGRL